MYNIRIWIEGETFIFSQCGEGWTWRHNVPGNLALVWDENQPWDDSEIFPTVAEAQRDAESYMGCWKRQKKITEEVL